MFLGRNLVLTAVCLLLLVVRNASGSYPPVVDDCGQLTYTLSSGVVRYSERYRSYGTRGCVYRIAVGQNNSVAIRLLSMGLQSTGGPCSRKWITLMCSLDQMREAITKTSLEICHEAKWSSSSYSRLRVSDCPVMFVIVHVPHDDTSRYGSSSTQTGSFQLGYEITQSTYTSASTNVTDLPEIDCGETLFTNRSGVISLPRRSDISRAYINCTYTIEAAEPRTTALPGMQRTIALNISHFDLLTLTDSLDACDQDRLRIECTDYNGENRTVWGCAQHSRPKYLNCVKLEIILRSDSYDPRPTRLISYYRRPGDTDAEVNEDENEVLEREDSSTYFGCGNTVFTAPSGNVTSPSFPLNYPHNIHCVYRIQVDQDKAISLNFRRFHLEHSSTCAYDGLKISCGLNEMNRTRKFCGDIQLTSALRFSNCPTVNLLFYADGSATRGGFQIEYSTSPRGTSDPTDEEVVCGRTEFQGKTGLITLPNNPSGFLKTINCTYNVYANDTSFIFLNMSSINLTQIASSIASCNIEQFTIACVSGEESWRFDLCQHKIWSPSPRFSDCQQVQIKLYSKYFDFQEAYEIPFTVIPSAEICEKTHFNVSSGIISSPGFPQYFPPNVTCTYSIAGTIGSTISISFLTFSIGDRENENYLSRGCRDWIRMTCQSSSHVDPYAGRRFCGPLTWPSVVRFVDCSTLLLQLSTSPVVVGLPSNDRRNGFSLNYTISSSVPGSIGNVLPAVNCSDLQYTSTSENGRISLPYNTSVPLVSMNCSFTALLNGSRKGQIAFNFYDFFRSPDDSSNCSRDSLTITCVSTKATANINSTTFLRYCWNALSIATVNYTDCDSIRFSLVHGAYNPQQPRGIGYSITSTDCGEEVFSASTGYVKSPSYPRNYPNNIHCLYTIAAGRNKTVSLQSLDLRIEGQGRSSYYGYDSCAHDWLMIRCSGGTERTSETDGPSIVRPPPDYEDYEDHDYYAYLHRHRYRDLRLMRRNPYSSPPSNYIDRRLCGSDTISTTLVNCEAITLEFHTDGSVAYQGFNIRYNTTNSSTTSTGTVRTDYICENQTFTESEGVINSPNFTDRINCTYVIEAGESKSVILQFLTLSSPSVSPYRHYFQECQDTWLHVNCVLGSGSVTPRNPLQHSRICTPPERNPILSGCQRVSIQFYSSVTAAQFRIRYTVEESGICGNSNFTNSTGTITSPGFPVPYLDNLNCTYYVEVGDNNWLLMRIRSFTLEGELTYRHYSPYEQMACSYDYLQVTCASGETDAASFYLGRRLCGYKSPFKIRLTGCKRAALRFVTDSSDQREGFQLQYKIIKNGEDECGSKIFSDSTGVISSPGYPSTYEEDLNCTYVVEIGGKRSSVSLHFKAFQVIKLERYPSHFAGCYSDWFQMRCLAGDVVAPTDLLDTRMCGQKLEFVRMLTGCQRLALQFYADSTFAERGNGFQIHYKIFNPDDVCGLTSFNKSEGTIAFPKPSKDYMTGFNCTYSVYVDNYSFVTFKFRSSAKTPDEKFKKETLSNDWILIFCRGEKLNESDKITQNFSSQTPRTISNCSVVDVIFHKENDASELNFDISYELGFHNDPSASGHSGSKPSAGVAIGIVAILIFAGLIVGAVWWWWLRRRRAEPKVDNRPFVADEDDDETDRSDAAITTTQDGFSFSVHQPDKASCKKYISLNDMS